MNNNTKEIEEPVNNINLDLLKEILTLQAESGKEEEIRNTVIEKIKELDITCTYTIDQKGNLLVTKGKTDLFPCIVSHLDDVHKHDPNKAIFQHEDTLFAFNGKQQIGSGGDDKVGMYICLQALIDYKDIKVVFFCSEETGCQGSNEVDLSFFKDCKFIIQPDRKGNSDLINFTNGTEVMSKDFEEFLSPIIKKHSYSFNRGTCTDIGRLVQRNVGVSSFNISCGYYEAHTSHEIVKISEVNKCYTLIKEIIDNCTKQYPFIKTVPTYVSTKYQEDSLVELLEEMYDKQNPKVVSQYKYGVKAGIKFVVDHIRLCGGGIDEVEDDYTLADEIEDCLAFLDEETHKCTDEAIPFYNNITNTYDYNCSVCKKDVTKEVNNSYDRIDSKQYNVFDDMKDNDDVIRLSNW